MSAALDIQQSTMRPEEFWLEVDDRLAAMGQQPALWTEELSGFYRQGIPVSVAVRCVIARRRVRS